MNTPDDPETSIRTDLWGTMDQRQLGGQRDLITTKISLLHSLGTGNPTVRGLMTVMQSALEEINTLIERKIT